MGGLLASIVFKSDYEDITAPPKLDIWSLTFQDIDENEVRIGDLAKGAKAVLFVNVATK